MACVSRCGEEAGGTAERLAGVPCGTGAGSVSRERHERGAEGAAHVRSDGAIVRGPRLLCGAGLVARIAWLQVDWRSERSQYATDHTILRCLPPEERRPGAGGHRL